MFKRYQHIERFGTDEVENITIGLCFVFPKIDGSNESVWFEDGEIKAGSRNRELTVEKDNFDFCKKVIRDEKIIEFFKDNPKLRLYMEFLVPHSLKTYKDDAWKKFYIFDVMTEEDNYLTYDEYKPLLEKYNLDYIPCLAKVVNGCYEQFINILEKNDYLIKDGQGIGEGIVIKNYDYVNRFGRKTFAKIVTSEFKEKHQKAMGPAEISSRKIIEEYIIENYLTSALIEKTFEKIKNDKEGWSSRYILELLNRVYHEFIVEEIWNIVKKEKNPKIDFKMLNLFLTKKIKEIKKELF